MHQILFFRKPLCWANWLVHVTCWLWATLLHSPSLCFSMGSQLPTKPEGPLISGRHVGDGEQHSLSYFSTSHFAGQIGLCTWYMPIWLMLLLFTIPAPLNRFQQALKALVDMWWMVNNHPPYIFHKSFCRANWLVHVTQATQANLPCNVGRWTTAYTSSFPSLCCSQGSRKAPMFCYSSQ